MNTTETRPERAPRIKTPRPVTPAEAATLERYLAQSVPDKHKIATERALLGQIARSTAIRVKCLQCCGYQREEIKVCTVITCALFPVRPYQDKTETNADDSEE